MNPDPSDNKKVHDLNSSVSALELAIDLIKKDWKSNPELVTKVIDLSIEKLQLIKRIVNEK